MRPLCLSGLLSDATSAGFLALTLHVLQCNRNDIQNELFFQIFGMKFQHELRPALEVIIQTKGQKGAKRNKATIQLYRWRAASHDNFPEPQRSEGMSRWGDQSLNQDDESGRCGITAKCESDLTLFLPSFGEEIVSAPLRLTKEGSGARGRI